MTQNIRLGSGPNQTTLSEESFVTISRIVDATELDVRVEHTNNSLYVYVGANGSEVYRYLVYPDGQILIVEKQTTTAEYGGSTWLRCEDPFLPSKFDQAIENKNRKFVGLSPINVQMDK